jgi:hypothetical protein
LEKEEKEGKGGEEIENEVGMGVRGKKGGGRGRREGG